MLKPGEMLHAPAVFTAENMLMIDAAYVVTHVCGVSQVCCPNSV